MTDRDINRDIKIRELSEIYGIDNVMEWVSDNLNDDDSSILAIDILLLPEAKKRINELRKDCKSLRCITFDEWLKWARKIKDLKMEGSKQESNYTKNDKER